MGFSTSGATLIVFLGVLVSASVFFPAAERGLEAIADATDDRNDRLLERRNAEIAFDNVTYNATSPTRTVVNVTNTGAVTLTVEDTDLLLNGTVQSGYTTAVDGVAGRSLWAPGETLRFEVDGPPGEPARVGVVTERGLARFTTNVTVVT